MFILEIYYPVNLKFYIDDERDAINLWKWYKDKLFNVIKNKTDSSLSSSYSPLRKTFCILRLDVFPDDVVSHSVKIMEMVEI